VGPGDKSIEGEKQNMKDKLHTSTRPAGRKGLVKKRKVTIKGGVYMGTRFLQSGTLMAYNPGSGERGGGVE